jgi:hypothetical protein
MGRTEKRDGKVLLNLLPPIGRINRSAASRELQLFLLFLEYSGLLAQLTLESSIHLLQGIESLAREKTGNYQTRNEGDDNECRELP